MVSGNSWSCVHLCIYNIFIDSCFFSPRVNTLYLWDIKKARWSKFLRCSCGSWTGRSNEKEFQSWMCEHGRVFSNLHFQCLGCTVCGTFFVFKWGTPRYLGGEFSNSVWIWNTLFTLLIERSTELPPLYPCTPSPDLNKVILINTSYPFTFIILPKLFSPTPRQGAFLTVTSSVLWMIDFKEIFWLPHYGEKYFFHNYMSPIEIIIVTLWMYGVLVISSHLAFVLISNIL